MTDAAAVFTEEWTKTVFPASRADEFFDALFGEAEEGAYDISLSFARQTGNTCEFFFNLSQRPGKCLACNLTYGLPQVFARHPILNVKGVAEAAASALGKNPASVKWELRATQEVSPALHRIPFIVAMG